MDNKIDFVITWVDGNDPVWRKDFKHYSEIEGKEVDKRPVRFRNWDNLQYWFRGVEKFAPWVNNIYFVTYGHMPEWLNVNHPKLQIVKHEDFIPKEYLPTFSSYVIEFFFHRIKGLSEKFVYFNDDMFLINHVRPERFFRDGLPCDFPALSDSVHPNPTMFDSSAFLAKALINKCFDKKKGCSKSFFEMVSSQIPKVDMEKSSLSEKSCVPWFYDESSASGLSETYL